MIVISRSTSAVNAAFHDAVNIGHFVRDTMADANAIGDARTMNSALQIYNALWIAYYGEEARMAQKLKDASRHLFLEGGAGPSSQYRIVAEVAALSPSLPESRRAFSLLKSISGIWPAETEALLNDEVNVSFLAEASPPDRENALRIVDTIVQAQANVAMSTVEFVAGRAQHEMAANGAQTLVDTALFDYQRTMLRVVTSMGLYAPDGGQKADQVLEAAGQHPHVLLRAVAFHWRHELPVHRRAHRLG